MGRVPNTKACSEGLACNLPFIEYYLNRVRTGPRKNRAMCRFSYFVYRGKLPVTVHSENKQLYCCVVEISKKELNGSDRNGAQLQNASRNLIRYSLRGSYVYGENLIDSLLRCEPTEIAEGEFKRLKKTRLDLPSS